MNVRWLLNHLIERKNHFRANEVILEKEEAPENLELLESQESQDQLESTVNQDLEDHEVNQVSEAILFWTMRNRPREATSKTVCFCKAF